MMFFTRQAEKPWQSPILTWLSSEYLWKLLSNSVAGSMTPIEGFVIYLWWFSGVVIFICPNLWDKAQNDFASWKQINGILKVCYKIFEQIQVYVLKMNKIGDSYLPCIAMAHSLQVFLWWPDWSVLVISRIYIYVYAFCIIFQHKFNCNYYGCLCSDQNDLFGFITTEQKWDVYMFLFASIYIYSWFFPIVCCLLQWM